MANVVTSFTCQGEFELYRIPPGNVMDLTMVPRGILHVFGATAVAAKMFADHSYIRSLPYEFPTDYSYRNAWVNASQEWENDAPGDLVGFAKYTSTLPINQFGAGSTGSTLYQNVVSPGGIHAYPVATKIGYLNWVGERFNPLIYGDANHTAPPTARFGFSNQIDQISSASQFWFSAGYFIYDLEQAHNYPINTPQPTASLN